MSKLSCQKSSFEVELIFSQDALFFSQKHFLCVKIQYLMSIYLQGIFSSMNRTFTVKNFVTLPPMSKPSCQKSSFEVELIFSQDALFFSQKRFLCVEIQYLMSIYLQGIVSSMNRKFTVKNFVTLPPMSKLSCQKSSFEVELIFSQDALFFSQKRFLCVKIQYLMSIYLQGIVSSMNRTFTVKNFVTLPPMSNLCCQKSSFEVGLIFLHV